MPDRLADGLNGMAGSDLAAKLRSLAEPAPAPGDTMIEMGVVGVGVSRMNQGPVVVLQEKEAGRYLPVWIGPAEANAIRVVLQRIDMPRPLTHDLLGSVIDALEGRVNSIVIHDLKDDIFYARIALSAHGRQINLDSRPSDAIAIALRVGAPIYAEEAVLDRAGVPPDQRPVEPLRLTTLGGLRP
ncbi:MAG: bifunctional nuclease family protein [Dehalococcoidia bacterium]